MSKQSIRKKTTRNIKKSPLPPIVIVPDKSYICEETGVVIPTDVILISDPTMYERMTKVLMAWGKEPLGIPGERGGIKE